ncbi:MAG: lysophospholipid acyltransferase family protein [Candidatus Paceibacterota bacterium]
MNRGILCNFVGWFIFWIIRGILKIYTIIFFCGSWFIPGKYENLTDKTQIVIARHISRNDIPLVLAALPRTNRILYVARKGLRMLGWLENNSFFRRCAEGKHIVFVDRNETTKEQAELITSAIKSGWLRFIVIFPEGATLPQDQCLNPGFVILARRYKLQIRPVRIIPWGCYRRKKERKSLGILGMGARHTSVKVGNPFFYEDISREEKDYDAIAKRAMEIVDRV